jgi:acetyl-CoA carboxylase beta subunit
MNDEKISVGIQIMMNCKNCEYRAIQSEIEENDGICPGCNEEFQPEEDFS